MSVVAPLDRLRSPRIRGCSEMRYPTTSVTFLTVVPRAR